MTTVYRRVIDLPGDGLVRALGARLVRDLDGCATTDDALDRVQPHELAWALAELSAEAGTPRRVAVISEAQAEEIRARGERAQAIMAMRAGPWTLAHKRPLAMYERGRGQGDPAHVVWLTGDGQVPRLGTREGRRQRVHVRWTLSAEVVERVRAEAERRGVPQSRVVEDALQAARGLTLPPDVAKKVAEADRLRKLFDDAGQGEHNVLALIDHYQRNSTEADERLRDHHPDERGPDCEVCLACRIGETVGAVCVACLRLLRGPA